MYNHYKQNISTAIRQVITISCIGIIISFILTACNGGASYNTTSSATAQIKGTPGKPKVSSINPANGAMNVFLDTSITVTYDYPVKSVNTTTFTVAEESESSNIDGEITAKGDNLTFTFTPKSPLNYETKYKVNLNGVKNYEDLEGGNTEDFSSSFSTVLLYTIFVTHQSWWGARIDGINGADRKCQDEADKHGFSGTYKAMIVGHERSIDKNWVLKPNTKYFNQFTVPIESAPLCYRFSATTNESGICNNPIGTTDSSAIFSQGMLDDFIYDRDGKTHKKVWTGMTFDWKVSDGNTCDNWDGNTSHEGIYGSSNTKETQTVIHYANQACYTSSINIHDAPEAHLYCVRQ